MLRDNELEKQLAGLQALYEAGGVPFNARDETQGVQAFMSKPSEIPWRICEYVAWAFARKWPSPEKTKRFCRLIEDGDGEGGIPERKLPAVRELSKGEAAQRELERRFREREGA